MGSSISQSIVYANEIQAAESDNETGIYGSVLSSTSLDADCDLGTNNGWDVFQLGKRVNPDGPCLGYRERLKNNVLGHYKWLSYQTVEQMALALGTALSKIIPYQEFPQEVYPGARKMKLLGIYSKNCIPWFVCEQAANAFGITLVPFYDTLKEAATAYIFKETGLSVAAGSATALNMFLKNPKAAEQLQHFIFFDDEISEDLKDRASSANVQLHQYSKLLSTPIESCSPGGPDSVNTLCYTSGTTGQPKSVILTHKNLTTTVAAAVNGPLNPKSNNFSLTKSDTYISYLPAAHVFERAMTNIFLFNGSKIGLFSGDTMKLLDDVQVLKPTVFVSVPRLFNRIHDKVFDGIKEKSALAQRFFQAGINTKLKQFRSENVLTHGFFDSLVFNKVKSAMGGELRYMIVGGAPLNSSVQEKIAVMFSTPLIQGYGSTESFGTSFIGHVADSTTGHVGGPLSSIEFKLIDIPELEYSVQGPTPCGEILLRGPSMSPGYFCQSELTRELFDEDGWFHTGDVGSISPNKSLKIIDRKKNIFKLSQGEYVCPEIIEALYVQSTYVAQIFVYGHSEQNSLVAIIVVNPDTAKGFMAKRQLHDMTLKQLCENALFSKAVRDDLDVVANGALKGFEKVKAIHLTPEPFTEENGLITPTQKIKRNKVREAYADVLERLYESKI